jgi:histone acetyltransferase 1
MLELIHARRYEKRRRASTPDVVTYHFVGYSSLYPFYCFPEKVRLRLRSALLCSFPCTRTSNSRHSQFVIIPPYQRRGLGCE